VKNIIAKSRFVSAAQRYPQYKQAIMDCYRKLKDCDANTPEELKKAFPSLDNLKYKDRCYVIDIAGGLRCVLLVWFSNQHVRVIDIFSHNDYIKYTEHLRSGK
jgi:mRNA interferase HigB